MMPAPAIFLSYAREDAAAARRIAEALRAAGLEVWFDENELRGGDAWDAKIRRQIDGCTLFLPIISQHTQQRGKGYFRLEWKLAVEQTHLMAEGIAFLAPIAIDETREAGALVPPEFLKVQWMRLPGALPTPEFVTQVKRLLSAPGQPIAPAVPRELRSPPESSEAAAAPARAPAGFGDPALQARPASRLPWVLGSVAAVAIVAALFFAWRGSKPSQPVAEVADPGPAATKPATVAAPATTAVPEADAKSVAVLPFANLSGDPAQEYFSDGLTEEILNTLARERDLRVPGRASAFSFKGKNVSSAQIAQALNVSRLVEGSVRKSGNKVRISVSLTRAADGFSEELGTFTEEMSDIFALQDKVARAVVEKLTKRTVTSAAVGLTKNTAAYEAYLKGRALQTRGANFSPEAAKLYEQAVALDPTFALAWARLAEARFRFFGGQQDRSTELVKGTRLAIDQALAAQPDLPEALIMRANWVRSVEFDYAAAQRDLDRAESLQPPKADLRYAQALLARDRGNYPESFRRYREALALDPQNGDYTNAYAVGLCMPFGEYGEAEQLFRRAMAIQGPGIATPFTNLIFARALWRGAEAALRLLDQFPASQAGWAETRMMLLVSLGRIEEARAVADKFVPKSDPAAFAAAQAAGRGFDPAMWVAVGREEQARERARQLVAESNAQFARANRAPRVREAFIRAEIFLGQRESALAALQEWRDEAQRMPSTFRRMQEFNTTASRLYALLGRADEAVALLQELRANGFIGGFGRREGSDFALIRDDPRFQEIIKQSEAWSKKLPDPVDP